MSLHEAEYAIAWRRQIEVAAHYEFTQLGMACHLAGCAALISHFRPLNHRGKPPREIWLALVYTEAAWAHCSPVKILASRKFKAAALARFRIWRTLRLMGYSYPGIAGMSGHDHTSLVSGIRRINRADFTENPFPLCNAKGKKWERAAKEQHP